MHFNELSERVGYGVYVNNGSMNNEKRVSGCKYVHEGIGERQSVYTPCSDMQVSFKVTISL